MNNHVLCYRGVGLVAMVMVWLNMWCLLCVADADHPTIKVGEFSEKIALVRADDDEGLEDEYTVSYY